ncbi:Asp23/Gls24 family envelope stress response protein [Microbispora bryophytorum]|uniref:Asp23/Gls24 family envelope stress response protein n=1 Tax=Microbispora bryophytorum subsp. camponoti TaxID=1677852 RepID=A0ABR8L9B4_9ACTN|nr:Asp23/Gls24 family envelope stress response protein [Microbispora camponoti]MBD3146252.1 Asp23/Gls24 family envelope stress response protein [Microbispora camponoti]
MSVPTAHGTTTISDRAFTRIAEQLASEDEHVTGLPHVSASVCGAVSAVHCDLAVRYPAPVPRLAAKIREHVRRRLRELTGIAVENVDIEVVKLVPERKSERKSGRKHERRGGDERRPRPA